MSDAYDLVIIGAGSAGISAAPFAARLGARVVLIEKGLPGGDCLYTGCVPSKALIRAARAAWEMRRAEQLGLPSFSPEVDLGRVMDHVQEVIQRVYQHESPEALAEAGVEVVLAPASFVDPHTVLAGERWLRGRSIIICTGGRSVLPAVPGLPETPHETYESIFQLRRLPGRLLVLGGGPIGLELAQAFQRLGSQVTVFQRSAQVLRMADEEVSAALIELLRAEGVQFRTSAQIERVEPTADGGVAILAGDRTEGDLLLVAAGRKPVFGGLNLAAAGVDHSADGIRVDEQLRTSQRHIYACGDVVGSHQFTHYAGWQGYVAVRNALLPGHDSGQRAQVPWTIFTDPEAARCGLTEREARERYGEDVRVWRLPLEQVDRAQTEEDRHGFVKVVTRGGGEILGAHIVAARAGEMIHEYVLAMERGISFGDLGAAMHVYPTYSIANQQLAVSHRLDSLLESRAGRLVKRLTRLIR